MGKLVPPGFSISTLRLRTISEGRKARPPMCSEEGNNTTGRLTRETREILVDGDGKGNDTIQLANASIALLTIEP